jgi:hypothetical protein
VSCVVDGVCFRERGPRAGPAAAPAVIERLARLGAVRAPRPLALAAVTSCLVSMRARAWPQWLRPLSRPPRLGSMADSTNSRRVQVRAHAHLHRTLRGALRRSVRSPTYTGPCTARLCGRVCKRSERAGRGGGGTLGRPLAPSAGYAPVARTRDLVRALVRALVRVPAPRDLVRALVRVPALEPLARVLVRVRVQALSPLARASSP